MKNQLISKENKNTIIKLIFNEILTLRDGDHIRFKNHQNKIKNLNLNIFNFTILLSVNDIFINTNEIIDCNKEVLKIGVSDTSIYIDSKDIYLLRGFYYLLRGTKINLFKIINRIINLENEQNKKILQCVSICNTLIKNEFRRPYELTEDIMSCY